MQSVIITFDALATNSIGCYGNEWVETPNWDRLAATGAVFDSHFVDTLGPLSGMAWSTGQHALLPAGLNQRTDLGSLLNSRSVQTRLVVSGERQRWQRAIPFDEVHSVGGRDGIDATPGETPFAEVVKAGVSVWHEASFQKKPRLLWLHTAGPGVPPDGFDELYFEDFEERGQQISELSDEARSQHPAVYAGAVSLLDHWLGELLAGIEADFADEPTLVIVMAARGYPWQRIRPPKSNESQGQAQALGDQLARTPLHLKVYGDHRFNEIVCIRSDRLVQTCDLVPTLTDWFGLDGSNPAPVPRSWLRELTEEIPARTYLFYDDGDNNNAVRTPDWLCIQERAKPSHDDAGLASLFVKPEDVWDINTVASQQPEIVAGLMGQFPKQS